MRMTGDAQPQRIQNSLKIQRTNGGFRIPEDFTRAAHCQAAPAALLPGNFGRKARRKVAKSHRKC